MLRLCAGLVLIASLAAGPAALAPALASPEPGRHAGMRPLIDWADPVPVVTHAWVAGRTDSGLPAETAVFGSAGAALGLVGLGWIVRDRARRPTVEAPGRRRGTRRHRPLPSRARVPARTGEEAGVV